MRGQLFVTCAAGLENILAHELSALGYKDLLTSPSGVHLLNLSSSSVPRAIYHINYSSRVATRVMLPLLKFECINQKELYKNVRDHNWKQMFDLSHNNDRNDGIDQEGALATLSINAVMAASTQGFNHSGYASQVTKDAICDQLRELTGNRPSIAKDPDVILNLYFDKNDMVTLSLDTSKVPLFKRGYRTTTGAAPLQESLAASLLYASNFGISIPDRKDFRKSKFVEVDPKLKVYDPCCGSGTILVEAALIASRTPSGYLRRMNEWGFSRMPDFSLSEFTAVKEEEDNKILERKGIQFFGTDIDAKTLTTAKINAKAAGVDKNISFHHLDFMQLDEVEKIVGSPSMVVSNPPYGARLKDSNLSNLEKLYDSLGGFMKHKTQKPASGGIITTKQFSDKIGLHPKFSAQTINGGLDCYLRSYELYDRSKKHKKQSETTTETTTETTKETTKEITKETTETNKR